MSKEDQANAYAINKSKFKSGDQIAVKLHDAFIAGREAKEASLEEVKVLSEEKAKELMWDAWKLAAHAYRLYPDNKHTFTEYWQTMGKDLLSQNLTTLLKQKP